MTLGADISRQSSRWGPLGEPIHNDIPHGTPPWRDNSYLCFWDPDNDVFGALHVSTSPNAEGRRSRLSLHYRGTLIEIVEPLDPGTFTSSAVTFDLGDQFTVDTGRVEGKLVWEPRFVIADYNGDNAPVAYGGFSGPPLQHFQQGATVTGHFTVDGHRTDFSGHGVRDRTWGFRDESAGIDELIGFMWMFPTFALTTIRLLVADGTDVTLGFRLDDQASHPVEKFSVTRDAAGLFVGSTLTLANGAETAIRGARRGGHWCPLGSERTGRAHSAFDEFSVLSNEQGQTGFGMTTQGVVRRLF